MAAAKSAVRIVLASYALVALLAMGLAQRLIFAPPPASYGADADVVFVTDSGGDRIALRWIAADAGAAAGPVVLFAHGNAEDLGDVTPYARRVAELGASVLLFDYPGYGASSGSPTEEGAYAAANAAYDWLTEEQGVAAEQLVVHGRSLGGAVAVDLAAHRPVAGLILESTFVSAFRVVTRVPLLPFDRFRSLRKLSRVSAPVLVMHGEDDEVVAVWHGRRLFRELPEARRSSLWVPGAHHNDLAAVAGARYWRALAGFLEAVREGAE